MFLDEVENLPVEIQQMLLRAMEERRYRPMGGRQDKRMDVRVIAATNEDLQGAVAEKRFRKDLLYPVAGFYNHRAHVAGLPGRHTPTG